MAALIGSAAWQAQTTWTPASSVMPYCCPTQRHCTALTGLQGPVQALGYHLNYVLAEVTLSYRMGASRLLPPPTIQAQIRRC